MRIMPLSNKSLFYENDVRVTKTAVKVIQWLVLVFPVLMILSVTGVFQTKVSELIPLTLFAVVVAMGPGIAYKMNTPIHIMKYVTTFALAVLVAMMAMKAAIGIYMTYACATD